MTLMEEYLEAGHNRFTDNWSSSPILFLELLKHKTNACGTVKINRSGLQKLGKKLSKGDCVFRNRDSLLHVTWQDKREVNMLSTMHSDSIIQSSNMDYSTGMLKVKPSCVIDYNKSMGSIDKSDMMLSYVETIRKSLKWYKKLLFHLMDICLLNSLYIWKVITGKNPKIPDFQLEVCRQLIGKIRSPEYVFLIHSHAKSSKSFSINRQPLPKLHSRNIKEE